MVRGVKNPPANEEMLKAGSIPGLGRSPGAGHKNPLHYFCLENLMTEEPGRLQSIGSLRVGYGLSDLACTHAELLPK